jgi:hypothetical protein
VSKLKHTPGPWKYENVCDDIFEIYDYVNQETITEYCNNEADARIIAAAPEMLEALMELSKYLFRNDKNSIGHKSAYHRLMNDIIEKATGMSIDEIFDPKN